MKEIDSLGLKMCSYQAVMFEKSITEMDCSSKIFIRRFMNSDLAKRMDKNSFLFESLDTVEAIKELEDEYGKSTYGKEKFSVEEMHWIGYIYRYAVYTLEFSSKQIYKMMNPKMLRKVYFPYHSLDPAQAIDRLMEEIDPKGVYQLDDISRGVIALRNVRSRHNLD